MYNINFIFIIYFILYFSFIVFQLFKLSRGFNTQNLTLIIKTIQPKEQNKKEKNNYNWPKKEKKCLRTIYFICKCYYIERQYPSDVGSDKTKAIPYENLSFRDIPSLHERASLHLTPRGVIRKNYSTRDDGDSRPATRIVQTDSPFLSA